MHLRLWARGEGYWRVAAKEVATSGPWARRWQRPSSIAEAVVPQRTSADRERRDVFGHRVECGFEGGGTAVNVSEEERSMDGGEQGSEQGGGQSVGVSGSSEVTALVHGP